MKRFLVCLGTIVVSVVLTAVILKQFSEQEGNAPQQLEESIDSSSDAVPNNSSADNTESENTKLPQNVTTDTPYPGMDIWSFEGLTITCYGLETEGILGPELYLRVTNLTGYDVAIEIYTLTIDDVKINSCNRIVVMDGNTSPQTICWGDKLLLIEEQPLSNVRLVFRVYNKNTFGMLVETPTISIDFE